MATKPRVRDRKKYQAAYYRANRARLLAAHTAYYHANKEERRAYQRGYYETHRNQKADRSIEEMTHGKA